ncbi:hypothetical protein [Nocardia sp. CDC160]|uniref:hypothetical protein n=1 Tax=Nocardia sp. CDC160 TaxID=3112166 RepID=UPI002DB93800|nr:hypothetical protein [Nocardia sp. CDC160]MEC3919282.1 hypothetical protein [Nocardia sp. CDC160]
MIEPDPIELDLDAARRIYPVGDHVVGVVTLIPRPGAIGLFVDLGCPPFGFVDVLNLPESIDQWPTVGTVTEFEVLQHMHRQVRLWPLDTAFQSSTAVWPAMSEPEWRAVKIRHPVGSEVTAEVTQVFPLNREYFVEFDAVWSALPWSGAPPAVGTSALFVVDRHLDETRRLVLRCA